MRQSLKRTPKVALYTDAADVAALPAALRTICKTTVPVDNQTSALKDSPSGCDSLLTWFSNDRIVEGSPGDVLADLHAPSRRSFYVVNVPCLEEVPFVTIQPRCFRSGGTNDSWNFAVRVENHGVPIHHAMRYYERSAEPWARLTYALLCERTAPGSGVESLLQQWESRVTLPAIIGALVLRNLFVVMLRHREAAKAKQFLDAGMGLYPGYSELFYLAALTEVREQRGAHALPLLEKAKSLGSSFPGSGGENTYRADWLLGVLAAQVGNQRIAFQHLLSGLNAKPVFMPAVDELLKLRLPVATIEARQYDFCRAARRAPQTAERILDYLLLHRAFDAARRIAQTIPLESSLHERFETRIAAASSPFLTLARHTDGRCNILLEGPLFEHSSLARINREIGHGLHGDGNFELRLEPTASTTHLPQLLSNAVELEPNLYRRLNYLDLTIRHQWPPDLRKPRTGNLAVIFPWEYGAVPRVWVDQIQRNVDELWVPSKFVRDVFARNGVDGSRITVIPNGFDPAIFKPDGAALRPQGTRGFVFFFAGGAIRRKGLDLLLDAYQAAFEPGDDVSLMLHLSGSGAAYQHNSLLRQVQAAANDPAFPHILPFFETVDDAALASLYRGADAFVLPYRGEGFGMPLVEALACGKPVVTTAAGPALDFCSDRNAYLVAAEETLVPDDPPPLGSLAGRFTWFEPDFGMLVQTLRNIYENRGLAGSKGRLAAKSVEHLTWAKIVHVYGARIRRLCSSSNS